MPEGFFDDKQKDYKARGIDKTATESEKLTEFMKTIAKEEQVSGWWVLGRGCGILRLR